MKYKVIVNGEAQAVWNTDKRYTLYSDTMSSSSKDKVTLRFDEERNSFIAKIENPSPKTLRLFNQGKLGLGITRCNNGKFDAWHLGSISNEGDENYHCNNHTKLLNHPRWSRVHGNITKVEDFDFIEVAASKVPGPMHNLVSYKSIIWSFYRAILVQIDNRLGYDAYNRDHARNYKTNCKTLKLNYNRNTRRYSNVEEAESIIDVQVTNRGNNTYQIFINNITGSFLNMYQNNTLMIGMKVFGPLWASSDKGWQSSNNRVGDENSHRCDMAAEKDKYKTHKGLRFTGQVVNNLMFNYTIPQSAIDGMRPKTHLTDLSYIHRTFDVKINCHYSIYLYYYPTGHSICTLVDNLLPYTWYEDQYWNYNDN